MIKRWIMKRKKIINQIKVKMIGKVKKKRINKIMNHKKKKVKKNQKKCLKMNTQMKRLIKNHQNLYQVLKMFQKKMKFQIKNKLKKM